MPLLASKFWLIRFFCLRRSALAIAMACSIAAPIALHAQCNGNTNARVYFPPGEEITDIVAFRYRFLVNKNSQAGLDLKILFAGPRLYAPGQTDTYSLESNVYTRGLEYSDPVCTTWPLEGTLVGGEASLRVAIPDYNQMGLTGAKTTAPLEFPRQSYLIDGLPIPKTDMISQINLNHVETEVIVARQGLVTDKTGWSCDGDLDQGTDFRQWDIVVSIAPFSYTMQFAVPDSNALYFAPWEAWNLWTEFFINEGDFEIFLWEFRYQRENSVAWEDVHSWIVDNHCGELDAYGVTTTFFNSIPVMEISNDNSTDYFPADTIFSLPFLQDGFEND